jgi:dihydrofolate reductase
VIKTPGLRIVASVAENEVIGKDGKLAWHNPSDLRWFKEYTMGKSLLMGMGTYASLPVPASEKGKLSPRKLLGRDLIVLTRKEFHIPNVRIAHSFEEALGLPRCGRQLVVIGGVSVYEEALKYAHYMRITRVHAKPEGDTYFPDFDHEAWCHTDTPVKKHPPGDQYPTSMEYWAYA